MFAEENDSLISQDSEEVEGGMEEDLIIFAEEESALEEESIASWKILLVDDEKEVHIVTQLALDDFIFERKRLTFLNAYSGAEAKALIKQHPDAAIIFLDVIMETEDAGFDVIRYTREVLNNQSVQIILRTGQPGIVPEDLVTLNYDINDYKTKTELTRQKLITKVVTGLRAYQTLFAKNQQLKQVQQAADLLACNNITQIKQIQAENLAITENLRATNQKLLQEIKAHAQAEAIAQQERKSAQLVNQLQSDFIACAAHELRTPVACIFNYLNLLKQGFYDDEVEMREYIEGAYIATFNLIDIIDDVLDFCKIEANPIESELKSLELEPLLEEICNMYKPQILKKGIELKVICEVDRITSDRIKLKQILTNLLSNAFKFTQSGTINLQIVRGSNPKQSEIIFSVIDTGRGIEPNKLSEVFNPFVQEDSSIRKLYGGTGLGLFICKKFVELMRGQIWLSSLGRNKGTTVSFSLPTSS